jgi:hypothetical protein
MERPRSDQTYSPVENLPPREQAIERVVGGPAVTPQLEEKTKQELRRDIFNDQADHSAELEKTERERAVVNDALAAMPDFISHYGGRPAPYTAEHLHFLSRLDLPDAEKEDDDCGGKYFAEHQQVRIFVDAASDEEVPKTELLRRVGHELMHGNAFQSADEVSEESVTIRRGGFRVRTEDGWLGLALDESMAEELNKRFWHEQMAKTTDAGYRAELRQAQSLLPNIQLETPEDEVTSAEWVTNSEKPFASIYCFAYRNERQQFNALLDDLDKNNKDYLPDREAAFTMFARAYFTGNLLPLGRLLDETYGKNALRRLMEGEDLTKKETAA